MVKVNNSDKVFTVPLTQATIAPMTWFEYHGQLYLAFEWQVDDSKAPSKAPVITLRAVCFDATYGAIESLFTETPDFQVLMEGRGVAFPVSLVYDKDVTINYITAKNHV
jgi:hypothetical protein